MQSWDLWLWHGLLIHREALKRSRKGEKEEEEE